MREMEVCDGLRSIATMERIQLFRQLIEVNFRSTLLTIILLLFDALAPAKLSLVDLSCGGSRRLELWRDLLTPTQKKHHVVASTFVRSDATYQWLDRTQQTRSFYQMPMFALSAQLVVPSIPDPTSLQVWAGLATSSVWSTRRPWRKS